MEVSDFTALRTVLIEILGKEHYSNTDLPDYSDYFENEVSFEWRDKGRCFDVVVYTGRNEFEICVFAWSYSDYDPDPQAPITCFEALSTYQVLDYAKRWQGGEDIQYSLPYSQKWVTNN